MSARAAALRAEVLSDRLFPDKRLGPFPPLAISDRLRTRAHPPQQLEPVFAQVWGDRRCIRRTLVREASRLLHRDGPVMRVRCPVGLANSNPLDGIVAWRQFTLRLPIQLLLAAATPKGMEPCERVELLPRHVAPTGPVAHLHIHASASLPFSRVWGAVMADHLPTPDDVTGFVGNAIESWRWLLRAGAARRWLEHVLLRQRLPHALDREHLRTSLDELDKGEFREGCDHPRRLPYRDRALHRALRLAESAARRNGHRQRSETELLLAGLHANDPQTVTRFLQYLRVQVALYRHLTTDPLVPGLSAFVHLADRMWRYAHRQSPERLRHLARDPDLQKLRSVEARISPPKSACDMLRRITTAKPPRAPTSDLEWGYVIHLIRSKGRQPFVSHDAGANGRRSAGQQITRQIRGQLRDVRPLIRAIERWPRILQIVRGIDVAALEEEGPLWSVLPALWRVLRASQTAAGHAPSMGVRPLRVTLHAGEDYRHILTGLSAIYAPMHWGLLRPGDRIGHGCALSADVHGWTALQGGQTTQPRFERLLDLLAVEHMVEEGLDLSASVLHRTATERDQLATKIWGSQPDSGRLNGLWRGLGSGKVLTALAEHPVPLETPSSRLLSALILDPQIGKNAFLPHDTPIRCDDAAWLGEVQRWLSCKVVQHGLAVEIHPSSNLTITGRPHLAAGDALRPSSDSGHRRPPVLIGADDPAQFATKLSDEYAYYWASAVAEHDDDAHVVLRELDAIAQNSWRFRFTEPASRSPVGAAPNGRHWRHPLLESF